MSLLKQTTNTSIFIPYEQFYMQSHYYHKELILEQNTGEHNPTYQLSFNTTITAPSAIYTDQYSDTHLLPRPQY